MLQKIIGFIAWVGFICIIGFIIGAPICATYITVIECGWKIALISWLLSIWVAFSLMYCLAHLFGLLED